MAHDAPMDHRLVFRLQALADQHTSSLPFGQGCGLTWAKGLGMASIHCINPKREMLMSGVP